MFLTMRLPGIFLTASSVKELVMEFENSLDEKKLKYSLMTILDRNETWGYDSFDEFISEIKNNVNNVSFNNVYPNESIELDMINMSTCVTKVTFKSNSRNVLLKMKNFTNSLILKPENIILIDENNINIKPVIFIGHGRSEQWRELKDHLSDKHKYEVIAYETGARAGHTIRDVIEDLLDKASFAILVMTAEDEMPDGTFRARQNVIHEIGLFQGKLGFSKAIVLKEEGADEFSNINGINQIRYQKKNIKETFGEVLAVIKREIN